MKHIARWIMLYTVLVFISCKQSPSKDIKARIQQQEPFWKNRTTMQNNITQEKIFPIPSDTTITEHRTNRIYLRSKNCQYEVFVNDVSLFKLMGPITKGGGGATGAHDMNQLLLTSGEHEVRVLMYPRHGLQIFPTKEGYMGLEFYYFLNRDLRTKRYNEKMNGNNGIELSQSDEQWISEYDYADQVALDGKYEPKEPAPLEGLPVYEWRSTFTAEVPFDIVGWRASVNLKEEFEDKEEDLENELFNAYKKVHAIIKERDVAGYLELVKEREELITTCLLYKEDEKPKREKEFVNLLANEDYEVEPLFFETFKLEYQAYGKLVMFLHKADSEGVIRLKNKKDPKDVIFLDFRFQRKEKGDGFTII
ncbi:hypothetical protein [Aquimarina aggregata]|uniref:hypothetical protein n=1 Tax=Aquimarina aggregata TaxID=1642818 RepID=UPI002490C2F4|nr:hypothetical protein [Aquimarina aggregata]